MDQRKAIKFDRVCVISLKSRPDRLKYFFDNLPDPWILGDIEIFDAIDGYGEKIPNDWKSGRGAWGCYQSHLAIIKKAIDDHIDNLLIFEDDAIFCDDFNNKVLLFLNNLPPDWEMFYLGGQHLKMPKQLILNNVVGVGTNINRTHAYGLSASGMYKIYNWLVDNKQWKRGHHIDHHYGVLQETGGIAPYCPLIWMVGQNEGLSNISRKRTSARWWL